MSWFLAGSALLAAGTTFIGGRAAQAQGIRNANSASKAEGEAIVKERLNATIRNSYNTALGQMQLGLGKRQLSQQSADISAAGVSAAGDVQLGVASTGSIGASTAAIANDVQMKVNQAQANTENEFENMLQNFNNDLDLMVLNTAQSEPTVHENRYDGPSTGSIIAGSLLTGVVSFASNYASRQFKLGLGPANVPSPGGTGIQFNASSWGR